MSKHTPTPWKLNEMVGEPWIMAGHLHVATIPRASDGDWSRANAEFIVRAVNAHDALVRALEEYRAAHAEAYETHGLPFTLRHQDADTLARSALNLAKKGLPTSALKLAKGEA